MQYGSGIAAVPAKDTVRLADDELTAVETPQRDRVWMMQTPQTFQYSMIRSAYEKVLEQQIQNITDDAMVLELGIHKAVKIVQGSYRNIKVTTPEDMDSAEAFAGRLEPYS